MKNLLAAILFLITASAAAQGLDFTWEKKISNVKGTIKFLNDTSMLVIIPEGSTSQRYLPTNLPDEYRVEGLKVTFTAMVGKIPPNVRMIGTPLKLLKITISKADMKRLKLKKCKYVFKA